MTCSPSGWSGSSGAIDEELAGVAAGRPTSRRSAASTARARRSSPAGWPSGPSGAASPPPRSRSPRPRPRCTGWRPSTAAWSSSCPPPPTRRARCARSSTPGSTPWKRTSSPRARSSPDDAEALAKARRRAAGARLADVARTTPAFAAALRAYRNATARRATRPPPRALIAWIGGQPNVAAAAKRAAGVKGDLDHFAALGFLQGLLTILRDSGHPGLLLVLDEIETLQRVRGDVRDKGLNALRQLIDEVDAGRFPGLYLLITGTPAFYDGPQGVSPADAARAAAARPTSAPTRGSTPRARCRSGCRLRPAEAGQARRRDPRPLRAAARAPQDRIARLVDDAYVDRSGQGGRRGARRPGRRRAADLPAQARRRRAGPGRRVPRLRPAAALQADPVRHRADRRRAQRGGVPARAPPTRWNSTCDRAGRTASHAVRTTSSTPSAGPSSARCSRRRSRPCWRDRTRCCSRRPRAARPRRPPFPCCPGWPPRAGPACRSSTCAR